MFAGKISRQTYISHSRKYDRHFKSFSPLGPDFQLEIKILRHLLRKIQSHSRCFLPGISRISGKPFFKNIWQITLFHTDTIIADPQYLCGLFLLQCYRQFRTVRTVFHCTVY